MATTRIDSQYSIFDARNEFLPANEIYITIPGLGQRRIDTLYYGDAKKGNLKPITLYKQLVEQAKKDRVYTGSDGLVNASSDVLSEVAKVNSNDPTATIKKENIGIPTHVDSYSINTDTHEVPFGLKRNVTMSPVADGTHALVKIDGETKYVKKSFIYFETPDGKKELGDSMLLTDAGLIGKTLYDGETGKAISEIYSATLFKPTSINQDETIDFSTETRHDYETTVLDDGSVSFTAVDSSLDTRFSEHRYLEKMVEGKAGKTETISVIEARNFVFDQGKDFIVVNGQKIFLDQINYLETFVSKLDRKILASDLIEGKKIIYDYGRKSKVLDEDILKTLQVEDDGRKKITVDGRELYLDDIDQVVSMHSNPTKENFNTEGKITYTDSDGNVQTADISAGQAIVYSTAGDHVYVTVNGRGQMVPIRNLRDEENNPIVNIEDMVGKRLFIYENQKIGEKTEFVQVGSTDELTYEQANMKYSTRKSFQPSEKTEADSTTYRKLESGEMVKESMINVPKAYKPTSATTGDAWLVKVTEGGVTRHVIVDKDYFNKYGDTALIKSANAKPVVRCSVGDNDCVAIQTTSRGKEVEECKYLGDITDEQEKNTAKSDETQAVANGIKTGAYAIDDVLIDDGSIAKLEKDGKRYEYTDKITIPDYAENCKDYKGLDYTGVTIKDGKVVGGVKYKMGKGLTKDFSLWGQILGYGLGGVAFASIFIPVVGPIAGVAYAGVLFGGPLFIAGKHIIKAAIKNNIHLRMGIPFKDRAKYNQKQHAKAIEAKISALYERMQSKDVALTMENFENEIATLKQEAFALSRANDNSFITAKDGTANVSKHNVNAALKYKKEYAETFKKYKELEEDLEEAKTKLDKGKISQEKYDLILAKYNHYKNKLNALKNGEFSEQNLDDMKKNTTAVMAATDEIIHAQKELVKLNKSLAKAKGKKRDSILEQIAAQEKIISDNERILNEETARSENLNTNRNHNNEVSQSADMNNVLGSIENMRALVYLKNFIDESNLAAVLGTTDATELEIIKKLKYDQKLGLTFEGKAIDKILTNRELAATLGHIQIIKDMAQMAEEERNEHYEELTHREGRAFAEQTRNEEVSKNREREIKAEEQAQIDKMLNEGAKQAKEARKTTEKTELESKKATVEQELRDKKDELTNLQRNLPQYRIDLADMQEELKEVKAKIIEEQRHYDNLSDIKAGNEALKVKINEKIKELKMQLTSPKSEKVATYINEKIKEAREEIHNADLEIMKVEAPLQQSQAKLNNLNSQQTTLKTNIQAKQNQINSEDTLISEVKSKEQELSKVEEELQALLDQIAADDKFIAEHPELQT